MTTERVVFRLIVCPHCSHQLCWINPRFPTYCPECGEHIFNQRGAAVRFRDDEAQLVLDG